MKVIITGAGIGGLTTALWLHHLGIDCQVYEQGKSIGELGVGINVLPHAVAELSVLGLLERLDEVAIRTGELIYAHRLGPEIMRRPCGIAAGHPVSQFSLQRGRLQGVRCGAVRERLGPHVVRTGHRLVGFKQDADGVRARFAAPDGQLRVSERADVLVAADGIHSTVRSLPFPDEGPPRWNGVMMWRGATEWPAFLTGHSMIIAGGTAAKLVVYPIAPGSAPGTALTNWAICIRTGRPGAPPPSREDWTRPADRTELAIHA